MSGNHNKKSVVDKQHAVVKKIKQILIITVALKNIFSNNIFVHLNVANMLFQVDFSDKSN